MFHIVTEDDLARARTDAVFRQKLMKYNLDMLLEALNKARKPNEPAAATALQVKEGADLAVKLADRLRAHAVATGLDPEAQVA